MSRLLVFGERSQTFRLRNTDVGREDKWLGFKFCTVNCLCTLNPKLHCKLARMYWTKRWGKATRWPKRALTVFITRLWITARKTLKVKLGRKTLPPQKEDWGIFMRRATLDISSMCCSFISCMHFNWTNKTLKVQSIIIIVILSNVC